MDNDTIAQISTPIGEGGISIIKISGTDAIKIVDKIFKGNKELKDSQTHKLNYGYIIENTKKIDEVLVSVMRAPNTYTGEELVEINCHGGILITNKILKMIVKNGARLAEAGEYTKRSFLNGKKTLEEADNIMDIIHSKSEEALEMAIKTLNNSTKKLIKNLREDLYNIVTTLEVNIDYPEYEDIPQVENEKIKNKLDSFLKKIDKIIEDSNSGQLIKNGITTSLIGKPNVGKSSILNYLSKTDRAIVTEIAGTTRDTIETEIIIGRIRLNLVDTAGIRSTDNQIEQIGIEKSLKEMSSSKLVLFVLDNNDSINSQEENILKKLIDNKKQYLILINKVDDNNVNKSIYEKLLEFDINKDKIVLFSTYSEIGHEELKDKIEEKFNLKSFDINNSEYLTQTKNILELEEVKKLLIDVQYKIKREEFLDLILIDLKEALFRLGDILGIEVKEEYLNEIFSRFCLGK